MKTYSMQWLIALASAVAASAQPPQGPGDRRPPPVPPLFAALDADRDKVVSAEEIETSAAALATLDKNSDGEITREEIHTPPKDKPNGGKPNGRKPGKQDGPPPGDRPVPPLVNALDTDSDGIISASEIEAAPKSLKSLDQNGDGDLTMEEIRPQGPPPGRRGPQGEGPEAE